MVLTPNPAQITSHHIHVPNSFPSDTGGFVTYTREVFGGGAHLNMCFHLELNSTLLVSFSIKPHPPCLSVKGWWTIGGSNSFYGNSIWVISLETCIKAFHLQTSSAQLGRPLFPWMYQHGAASSPGLWPLQFPLAPDAHSSLGIELDSTKCGGRWALGCFSQPSPCPECIVFGPTADAQQL